MGLKRIIAYVHKDNIPAYKTYIKVGFRVVGEKPLVVGGEEYKLEINESDLKKSNESDLKKSNEFVFIKKLI